MKVPATIWLSFLIFLFSCNQGESKKERPNILFILADDLGAYDLSCTNDSFYESPNIDRLAKEGAIFTNGYAAAQVCSPSRASILTGKNTVTHGITDWIGAQAGEIWGEKHPYTKVMPPGYRHQLDSSEITLAELFRSVGYKTFFAGKWHLGSKGAWPEDHGFDINKGGWNYGNPRGGYFSPYKNANLSDGEPGENLSERLAWETATFIRESKGKPFFAFLSFYAVHGPIQSTRQYWKKYRNKALSNGLDSSGFEMERRLPIRTVQDNPIYAGLIQHMDDAVGIVLEELEKQGLDDNTIVVFTSDNGGVASGDAYATTNSPLRGGKGYQWEGGVRVPYIIKVPGIAPKKVDYPASGQDFYATLSTLSNIEIPTRQKIDGVDLLPVLEGKEGAQRALVWHYPHYGNQGGDPASMLRRGDHKLIYYWETDHFELYDLSQDISEQNDISADNVALATRLKKELFESLDQVKYKRPRPNPYFSEQARDERMRKVTQVWLPNLEDRRLQILEEAFQPNEDWWGSATTD